MASIKNSKQLQPQAWNFYGFVVGYNAYIHTNVANL